MLCLVLTFFFSAPSCLYAEEAASKTDRFITDASIIVGYGTEDIDNDAYEPIFLICRLGHDLTGFFPGLARQRGTLSAYLETQVNPVVSPETDVEFGIGLGLKYQYPLSNRLAVYAAGSVGPHYITVTCNEQENGFVFANTIGGGLSWFLTGKSAISVEYRFRHLSNADLAEPNGGINSHIVMVGYLIFF